MKRFIIMIVCAVLALGVSAYPQNPLNYLIPRSSKTAPKQNRPRQTKPEQQKAQPANRSQSKPKNNNNTFKKHNEEEKATEIIISDDIISTPTPTEIVVVEEKPVEKVNDNKVFTSVDQQPEFPGGQNALMQWLANNIRYPAVCQENYIQGKVTVQFVVKKDGSIGEVKVVRGKDPDLDREAIRVVKTLPRFTPGKMNGQPVSTLYTLPITFRLPD